MSVLLTRASLATADNGGATMADIFHDVMIKAPRDRVFEAFATPAGLDRWWTKASSGEPREGAAYTLGFGPEYDWRARVTRCIPGSAFEVEITQADPDWTGTRVGCRLESKEAAKTCVHFYHTGWPTENEHWRVSCYCWAMYLRLLRRYVESGEFVPYEKRLEV
jgi:uncharacterized protein YndB with AHSA1/START domain